MFDDDLTADERLKADKAMDKAGGTLGETVWSQRSSLDRHVTSFTNPTVADMERVTELVKHPRCRVTVERWETWVE